jgi:hypothetical protein
MRNTRILLSFLITFCFLISGCAVLVIGGLGAGAGTGTYYYSQGAIHGSYSFPLDKVWAACEKTMSDLRAKDVKKTKAIGSAEISSTINDVKTEITLEYLERNNTAITIRKGRFGDETASKFLYDKIRDNISQD